jgi:hypothetical protein
VETCGPYKIIFETGSGPGWASFQGRDTRGEVLITVFTSGAQTGREIIDLQQRASAASPHVAPVLDSGDCEGGQWYATHSYPRTLGKLLDGRVELNRPWLLQLLLAVTRGALAFKKTCGRSHGNLHSHNILLGGTTNIKEAQMVIKDPVGGEGVDPQDLELRDLKAIGMTLYQLVRRREVDEGSMILPLDLSPEWQTRFGKDAQRWVDLCNLLLTPGLSLDRYSLEQLENDLVSFQPKAAVSRKQLVAAAVVLAAGGIVGLGAMWWSKQATLEVTSNLPGATVTVTADAKVVVDNKTLQTAPITIKVRKGASYIVQGQRQGFGTNFAATAEGVVQKRKYLVALTFQYGTLKIEAKDNTGKTLLSAVEYVPPDVGVKYPIDIEGYDAHSVITTVGAGQTKTEEPVLKTKDRLAVRIEIAAVPVTATVEIRDANNNVVKAAETQPVPADVRPGRYKALVTYRVVTVTNDVAVTDKANFRFVVPTADLTVLAQDLRTGQMVDATVFYRGTNIGATKSSIIWPTGTWPFAIEAAGYKPVTTNLTFTKDTTATVKLDRVLAIVNAKSDPPNGVVVATDISDLLSPTSTKRWKTPATLMLPPGTHVLYSHHPELGLTTNQFTFPREETYEVTIPYVYREIRMTSPLNVVVLRSNNPTPLKPSDISLLPRGVHGFTAFSLELRPFTTNHFTIAVGDKSAPFVTNLFSEYGQVILSAIPNGGDVRDENMVLIGAFTEANPAITVKAPYGPRKYHFKQGDTPKTYGTNVTSNGPYPVVADFTKPKDYTVEQIGLVLIWVPHMELYVGRNEVTQLEYRTVMQHNPSAVPHHDNLPVNTVTHSQALEFCKQLQTKSPPPDGWFYTLPTEQQWKTFVGNASDPGLAVFSPGNAPLADPAPVRSKGPNLYGLHDVRGNVFEWTFDGLAIGSGYSSPRLPAPTEVLSFRRKVAPTGDKVTGFRIILAPRPPTAVAAGGAQ